MSREILISAIIIVVIVSSLFLLLFRYHLFQPEYERERICVLTTRLNNGDVDTQILIGDMITDEQIKYYQESPKHVIKC